MIKITNMSEGQEDMFFIIVKDTIKILIDGGNNSKRCKEKLDDININIDEIDYIILTHTDQDHINGLLGLLKNRCENTVIVYNKFINGLISYKQAEKFEKLIQNREVIVPYKEYQDNAGDIIFLSINQRKKYPIKDEEVYITFLNPSKEKVEKLRYNYDYYKSTGKTKSNDAKIVNGSSIMFILEYDGKRVLFTGDGYIGDILPIINDLSNEESSAQTIKELDLIKLPHHGSLDNNKQLDELLTKMHCEKFIITNGESGNVKIEEDLEKILEGKTIYINKNCDKYRNLKIIVNTEIDL